MMKLWFFPISQVFIVHAALLDFNVNAIVCNYVVKRSSTIYFGVTLNDQEHKEFFEIIDDLGIEYFAFDEIKEFDEKIH